MMATLTSRLSLVNKTKFLLKMSTLASSSSSSSPMWLSASDAFEFGPGFGDREEFLSAFLLAADFVSVQEEQSLMKEMEPHLVRQVYQHDHWDDAIIGYRETERKHWNRVNAPIIERLRRAAFESEAKLLPHTHLLDLAAEGHIKPHVDSVKFCGSTVAVLSLLSDAVARFVDEKSKSRQVDVFLPRRSLYVMKGISRHDFTHEILPNNSLWRGRIVKRERRISVIARCQPDEET